MWSTLPFCLDESLRGHHHLFDAQLVRRSFEPFEVDPAAVAGAKEILSELRREEDLAAQRQHIARAPESAQRLFVRIYFDYLDAFARGVRVAH